MILDRMIRFGLFDATGKPLSTKSAIYAVLRLRLTIILKAQTMFNRLNLMSKKVRKLITKWNEAENYAYATVNLLCIRNLCTFYL